MWVNPRTMASLCSDEMDPSAACANNRSTSVVAEIRTYLEATAGAQPMLINSSRSRVVLWSATPSRSSSPVRVVAW